MIRTLVIDDEQPARSRLRELLDDCRAELPLVVAGEAENGIEGLDLLSAAEAELVLVDIHMPGMSGIELAKTLAPARPDMRIVVMSWFTEQTLKLREAGLPAMLLPKPFSPSDLQRVIADVLAGGSPGRA